MGLFNHHQRQSSSASSMEHNPSLQTPSRASSSSARSVHSTHSNATLKANRPRHSPNPAYAVGMSTEHHQSKLHGHADVDMTDYADPPGMQVHHASRYPPVPPARTSSLAEPEDFASQATISSLPTVAYTHATPTKHRREHHTGHSMSATAASRGSSLGYGSLYVTEDEVNASKQVNVSNRELKVEMDEYESEEEARQAKLTEQERTRKKAKEREQGRKRQARKRERDRKAKEEAKSSLAGPPFPDPSQSAYASRNASTASLAPLNTPLSSATTPPFGASTSTSSFQSSLPTSASMTSLSPGPSPFFFTSQHMSGTASPSTVMSPVASMSGTVMPYEQQSWAAARTFASRSAVDIRSPPATSEAVQRTRQGNARGPSASISIPLGHEYTAPNTPTVVISPSGQMHPSKRRRSEPEPEMFKKSGEVGLGVIGITEHEQESIEYLDSPVKAAHPTMTIERPGIRRTASDSAAITLDMSNPQGENRSPTPPPIAAFKDTYKSRQPMPPGPSKEGEWFAETIVTAVTCSEHAAVHATMSQLNITTDDLKSMAYDLATCFDKLKQSKLEKKMREINLNDPAHQANMPSTVTSVATTPLQESAPLSTTSTSSSSPTASKLDLSQSMPMSYSIAPSQHTSLGGSAIAHATPKTSNVPSRARSLSSASLRARGHKAGSKIGKSPSMVRPQAEQLVSPLSTTAFHFPNTPSHHMHGSDGASPMPSSVATPVTGQSAHFNHDEIDAVIRAGQGGYGGMGGHERSATDPMGSKFYSTRQQHSVPSFHPSSGADNAESYNRASASSSGLSSPVDISHYRHHSHSSSYGQLPTMPAPPPHQYPSVQSSGEVFSMPDTALSFNARATPSGTVSSRQYTYSHPTSAGAPFTPTGLGHRPSASVSNAFQPLFGPIPEQGTPTRPSSHQATPVMMDHEPHRVMRQSEMDQRVLSPNPPTVPVPFSIDGNWTNIPVSQPGELGQMGLGDPFVTSYHHPPPT